MNFLFQTIQTESVILLRFQEMEVPGLLHIRWSFRSQRRPRGSDTSSFLWRWAQFALQMCCSRIRNCSLWWVDAEFPDFQFLLHYFARNFHHYFSSLTCSSGKSRVFLTSRLLEKLLEREENISIFLSPWSLKRYSSFLHRSDDSWKSIVRSFQSWSFGLGSLSSLMLTTLLLSILGALHQYILQ